VTGDRSAGLLTTNLLFRAVLTAIGLVVALLPATVALGAFVPTLPTIGRFGALVNTDLPWLALEALVAAGLALLALRLGGGRFTRMLAAFTTVTAAALLAIAGVFAVFASQHGASYSIVRQATTPGPDPAAETRMVYATIDGVDLHADVWRATTAAGNGVTASSGVPAVVFIHGGAFTSGGRGSRAPFFATLAGDGYTVIDLEYRLAPPPRWADAPGDILCALGWLQATAGDLDIDPDRVVVMGESAGGSLALLAGYAAGTELLTPSCARSPIVPIGVIAISPAADLAGIWSDDTIAAPGGGRFPEPYIGGTPAEYPDRYDQASPFRLIRPGLPPTLLLTGANDHLVLVNRVTEIAARLTAAGDRVTTVVLPFLDHGLDGLPNGFGVQMEESIAPAFLAELTR
jgi:acetyl esterase/lipase